ncbi:MAG: alpha-2-macroglobulin family protein, partial [Proteobacteria bacterium]|nr:alpha-2-macroglobulin family protein [Pseudomonadota bacterium]
QLKITITTALTAENGGKLLAAYHETVETADVKPIVGFASTGVLLPIRLSDGLPVVTVDVDKVDIDFFKIRTESIADFYRYWTRSMTSIDLYDARNDLTNKADLVYTGRFELKPRPHTRETQYLPIFSIKELRSPGAYYAVMRQAGEYRYEMPAAFFTMSDIGVSVHRYNESLSVFCQSLETGKALSGVNITLLDEAGKHLETAKTDASGYAPLQYAAIAKGLIAVRGDDTTLVRLNSSALDLSEFNVGGTKSSALQFFAFSPRDLYRPGEVVPVNALLRDIDGNPANPQPVVVTVQQADGKIATEFTWNADKNGLYQYHLRLSEGAPTGKWTLHFDLGVGNKQSYEFLVEDFLPERMALEIKTDDRHLLVNEAVSFKIAGRYLYGAPASGNGFSSYVHVSLIRQPLPSLPGYLFGSSKDSLPKRNFLLEDGYLDDDGETTVEFDDNEDWHIQSPIKLNFIGSLQESGGRSVNRSVTKILWPGRTMPGIRGVFSSSDTKNNDESHIDANSTAAFEIVLANMDGQKLASDGLMVRLVRERRDYYWVYSDSDGWNHRYHEKELILSEETVSIKKDSVGVVSFPLEWGPYRVEVTDPDTGLMSDIRVWAGYSWQNNTKAGSVRPDQVKIELDKPSYTAGDVAQITLKPPSEGSGYLMVESSDGPLFWQSITVPAEGKTYDIPIPKEWARHDLYINALIVRPGDKKAFRTPKRAVGLLHLPLERSERKLDLAILAPQKMRPNEPLTIKIQAKDFAGKLPKDARVIISAVDEGIHNITKFETPDPFRYFFTRKAYGVDQLDIYGSIIEAAKGNRARLAFGGDDGYDDDMLPTGKRPDSSVLIVALQSDVLEFDARGMAEVKLDIPDFNGSLRLMAQAWNENQFGMAEEKVTVAAPLVAEISMPRFLAGGDEAQFALDLTNLSGQDQVVSLNLNTEGPLTIKDDPSHDAIAIKNGERKTLIFRGLASGGLTAGIIRASVTGLKLPEGKFDFERHWQIGIRPAYPIEIQQFRTSLRPGESWIAPPNSAPPAPAFASWLIPLFPDHLSAFFVEGREVLAKVSDKMPLNLGRHIQELVAYPYGCLEQTTSGIYPFLYLNENILTSLGIKGDADAKRREKIDIAIGRILTMQRHNGSFGMWSRDSDESFWLTVYATDFLLRARELGFSISETALKKATERLVFYLNNAKSIGSWDYSENTNHTRFAVQAYAAYVLARSQQAPLGALRAIYNGHKENPVAQNGLPLIQLGIALKLMGDDTKGQELIAQGVAFKENATYRWYGDYGSKIRNDAMSFALLAEHSLNETDQNRLLFRLSDEIMDKTYLSTQERNAAVLAGRFLLQKGESDWTADVTIGNEKRTINGRNPSIRLSDANVVPMTFTNNSTETLYAEYSLAAYPNTAPEPSSNVIQISRRFLRIDAPTEADLTSLKSGDMVLVHITLKANRRVPDALIVDFLPAGFELENQNLSNASINLDTIGEAAQSHLRKMQNTTILHQEFRGDRFVAAIDINDNNRNRYDDDDDDNDDDGYTHILYLVRAVTPGQYVVPPPTVHSMYRPEWKAVGTTPKTLIVKSK